MTNPVPGHSVSTAYKKTDPDLWNTCGFHTGQDYAAPKDTTIVAARGGTVVHVNYGSAFGPHSFVIRPGDGTEDFYAHTLSRPVNGATVKLGDAVARVGNLGNTTGYHLHFERHKSYGWNCSVLDDPMKSHNYSGGSSAPPASETDDDMFVFFQYKNGIWLGDGMHRRGMKNPTQLNNAKNIISSAGKSYIDWPGGEVDDPDAFGLEMK